MPTVLVIAAQSFIGRHICRALSQRGSRVISTSRQPAAGSRDIACDLKDAASIAAAIRDSQPDWLVQCGAATSSRDPRELYLTHAFGTLNLCEAVEQHAPEARVLLMGSAAEYGSLPVEWLPLHEECLPSPSSFFGASKLAQTQMAQAAAAEKRLRIVSVRPFNVIGPGLPEIYFAASLSKRLKAMQREGAVAGTAFEVTNATATRDFVDVRDVAEAVTLLLEKAVWETGTCEVFNIATSRETSLIEMASVLGELAGGLVPKAGGSHSSRGGISRSSGSFEKLADVTGWQPRISWQQSLRDLWTA